MRADDAGHFPENPKLITTAGEILSDGTVLDIVTNRQQLLLLHFDGERQLKVPYFEHDNIIYSPLKLDKSLDAALRFPSGTAEYGSVRDLFAELQGVFKEHAFTGESAGWAALFALSSWVPELFSQPPTLVIWGSNLHIGAAFLLLLNAVCRRPLLCTQLSPSLPFQVRPTLLTLANRVTAAARDVWRASNLRSVWVPVGTGRVENFSGPRGLFVEGESLDSWNAEEWRLSLLPDREIAPATDLELEEIADRLQPRLLLFRLRQLLRNNSESTLPKPPKKFATARTRPVFVLVEGDPEIISTITPLMDEQQRESAEGRLRDPLCALIECLWHPSHKGQDISIKDLTTRLNVRLRTREETVIYDERDVGWMLRRLRIQRQRSQTGMFIRFTADLRCKVHNLAKTYCLDLPRVKQCRQCRTVWPGQCRK